MLRSAIPLKTVHGDSLMLMITDEKSLIKVITQFNGRTIAVDYKWQTYPGKLDLICQTVENRVLFTARGNNNSFGSTCIQDRIISCDFEQNKTDHCVIDNSDITIWGSNDSLVRTTYQCVGGTSKWRKTLMLERLNETPLRVIEPYDLTNLPSFYLPSINGACRRMIYFYDLPTWDSDIKNIAVLSLDSNTDSYSVIRCLPDCQHGYPKGKLLNRTNRRWFEQCTFVTNGKFYCLEISRDFLCTAVWILNFYDEEKNFNPCWIRFQFVKSVQLIPSRLFKLIVNDQEEILVAQIDDKKKFKLTNNDYITVILCCRLKVPTLKHLTSRIVLDFNPKFVTLTENEQRQNGIPYGSIPSCPWMKIFSQSINIED